MEEQNTCRMEGCNCTVAEGQDYCSDFCRDHEKDSTGTDRNCGCGHPGCR